MLVAEAQSVISIAAHITAMCVALHSPYKLVNNIYSLPTGPGKIATSFKGLNGNLT